MSEAVTSQFLRLIYKAGPSLELGAVLKNLTTSVARFVNYVKTSGVIYHAYLDDSADRDRERVVIAAGIVGSRNEWGMLTSKWKTRLQEHELQYFKSSDCENLHGEFRKFRRHGFKEGKQKALAVRDDLYHIVKGSPMITLGVTLSIPFYRTMSADPQAFGAIPTVPYRLVFQQVLAECAKATLLVGRNHAVTFAHDNANDFHELHRLFEEFKHLNPQYATVMRDFVPADDKFNAGAQAADVAAWIIYQHAKEYASNNTVETLRQLGDRMYKVVNWIDQPHQRIGLVTCAEEAPAVAIYAT